MKQYRIEYIHIDPKPGKATQIHAIGGYYPNGEAWLLSQQQAIKGLETGLWSFYIKRKRSPVSVGVVEKGGKKYLSTDLRRVQKHFLLELPHRPGTQIHFI